MRLSTNLAANGRMRLLFLTNFYPPHDRGGYEQNCRDVVEALRSRRHDVRVVTSDYGSPARANDPSVARVLHTVVDWRPYRGTIAFAARGARERESIARFRNIVGDWQPDVVFVWGMWDLPVELLRVAETWPGLAVAYYISDYWPSLPDAYALHWAEPAAHPVMAVPKRALRQLARLAVPSDPQYRPRFEHAACVSIAVREALARTDGSLEDAAVVHNGIDPEPFLRARPAPLSGAPSGPLRALYAGRLSPEKGVHTAVDAIAQLSGRGVSISLTIVGAGSRKYERALRSRVQARGIDAAVTFVPWLAREAMPALMAQNDVFLYPADWEEPLPLSPQQAMAAGMAVVASRVGGIPELIQDGVNGLLCAPGDANELAWAIERLSRDAGLRVRLAEAGRRTILERFTIDRMVDKIEAYLLGIRPNP